MWGYDPTAFFDELSYFVGTPPGAIMLIQKLYPAGTFPNYSLLFLTFIACMEFEREELIIVVFIFDFLEAFGEITKFYELFLI